MLASMCDDKTVREIGAAYRLRTPDEGKQDNLISLLLSSSGGNQGQSNSEADNARLAQQLDKTIRDDFATNKVLNINGWVLSLTEARQCALYSLSKQ
jgi:hypothetical protein